MDMSIHGSRTLSIEPTVRRLPARSSVECLFQIAVGAHEPEFAYAVRSFARPVNDGSHDVILAGTDDGIDADHDDQFGRSLAVLEHCQPRPSRSGRRLESVDYRIEHRRWRRDRWATDPDRGRLRDDRRTRVDCDLGGVSGLSHLEQRAGGKRDVSSSCRPILQERLNAGEDRQHRALVVRPLLSPATSCAASRRRAHCS
jgi:hypothetical protein